MRGYLPGANYRGESSVQWDGWRQHALAGLKRTTRSTRSTGAGFADPIEC
jgi:hypothetical protein